MVVAPSFELATSLEEATGCTEEATFLFDAAADADATGASMTTEKPPPLFAALSSRFRGLFLLLAPVLVLLAPASGRCDDEAPFLAFAFDCRTFEFLLPPPPRSLRFELTTAPVLLRDEEVLLSLLREEKVLLSLLREEASPFDNDLLGDEDERDKADTGGFGCDFAFDACFDLDFDFDAEFDGCGRTFFDASVDSGASSESLSSSTGDFDSLEAFELLLLCFDE